MTKHLKRKNMSIKKNHLRKSKNNILINIIYYIYDISGIHFIKDLLLPDKAGSRQPSRFLIWLVGIYVSLFTIASAKFEYRSSLLQNRADNIITLYSTDIRSKVLERIPVIQHEPCPIEPFIFHPSSVYQSFIQKGVLYEPVVNDLKDFLVDVLRNNSVKNIQLSGVILTGSAIRKADLSNCWINEAFLDYCDLWKTDFTNSNLQHTDFSFSDMEEVIFTNSYLSFCNFTNTKNLDIKQLLKSKSLYNAILPNEIKTLIEKSHPELLRKI
jgi:hypothetical protein